LWMPQKSRSLLSVTTDNNKTEPKHALHFAERVFCLELL
jgi:hypothetical protein